MLKVNRTTIRRPTLLRHLNIKIEKFSQFVEKGSRKFIILLKNYRVFNFLTFLSGHWSVNYTMGRFLTSLKDLFHFITFIVKSGAANFTCICMCVHTWASSWRSSGPKIGKWGRSSTPNSKNYVNFYKNRRFWPSMFQRDSYRSTENSSGPLTNQGIDLAQVCVHCQRELGVSIVWKWWQAIRSLVQSERTSDLDAARLVMLYALRYEAHANSALRSLLALPRIAALPDSLRRAPLALLEYGRRRFDLFGQATDAAALTKKLIKGLKVAHGSFPASRLTRSLFRAWRTSTPSIDPTCWRSWTSWQGAGSAQTPFRPCRPRCPPRAGGHLLPAALFNRAACCRTNAHQEIVIFFVGGMTYEEALAINNFNKANANTSIKVIIGGSTIHNTRRWGIILLPFLVL